ncbi:MAG: hypothetical protein LYZ70_04525 [Nitrososphaerales archaeon]|nr:hypothetical protein [Nitrososphaerales archaeon]
MADDPNEVRGTDLALCLLYLDDQRPIDGMTKFEKLLFLTKEEVLKKGKEEVSEFRFEPDRFGPLAVELYDELEYLESSGLMSRDGNRFKITDLGKRYFESKTKPRVPSKVVQKIQEVKKRWDREDLGNLLRYVYQKYPDYTVNSEIRDKVLG